MCQNDRAEVDHKMQVEVRRARCTDCTNDSEYPNGTLGYFWVMPYYLRSLSIM